MKKSLFIASCLVVAIGLAHTLAEKKVEVEILVHSIMGSPEWDDNIRINENRVPIQSSLQHYDDLFANPRLTNYTGVAWTSSERKAAFEEFVSNIPELSTNGCYRGMDILAPVALGYCVNHKQTNVIDSVLKIIAATNSAARDTAMLAFEKLATPCDRINSFTLNMATNDLLMTGFDRQYFLGAYIGVLERAHFESDPQEFTNGIAIAMSAVKGAPASIALDKFLLDIYADYEYSSDRLQVSQRALADLASVDRWYAEEVKDYFTPITNQLTNAVQPLPEVEALRGL